VKLISVEGRTEATNALRRRIKNELEEQILDYYTNQGGQVVILDANNGNIANRKETYQKFESKGVHVIFLGMSIILATHHQLLGEVADDRINM
jgi:hypothetical protein